MSLAFSIAALATAIRLLNDCFLIFFAIPRESRKAVSCAASFRSKKMFVEEFSKKRGSAIGEALILAILLFFLLLGLLLFV